MRGFKNQQLNEIAKEYIYEEMIDFIFVSLEQMKKDFILQDKKIKNNEEKIRTHLVENYLNNTEFKKNTQYKDLPLLFNSEVAEAYDKEKEEYKGRVDIKVISINTILSNHNDYYIIECKRLDGSSELNQKFVIEGICRFVLENPKYSSFNKRNIMLGFIVKNIDINMNTNKINDIQNNNENINIIEKLNKCQKLQEQYYLYKNKYKCEKNEIELSHMFYNLADIIKN